MQPVSLEGKKEFGESKNLSVSIINKVNIKEKHKNGKSLNQKPIFL